MTSSVDGLVSGLSTTSLIQQLMTVEAAPQTRLKNKVTTAQTAVASYQSVNSKISALKTAADNLGQLSTWRAISATSSSSSVTATALVGTNGASGTTIFDVKAVAKGQITTARVPTSGDIMSGTDLSLDLGPLDDPDPAKHVVTSITPKTKTAQGVADAINAAGAGVKATVITTGSGENILQFSGSKTGAANAFTITGLDQLSNGAPLTQVTQASDARLEIGGGDADLDGDGFADGYVITSSTNTFSNNLMPGVSITVSKLEDNVTVTSTSDVNGMAGKIQALVDAANGALTEIGTQTAYDASTKSGSPLTGDFAVRNMTQTILSAISQGLSYDDPKWVNPDPVHDPDANAPKINFGTLAQFGVQLDSTGQLTFDSAKFAAAYNDNPSKIQEAGTAFADQFEATAATMTTNIKSVITGRNSEIDLINSQIDDWDVRLAARQQALQKQYSDLEVALGKLKDQSNWLAGQLAGLGGFS